MIALTEVDKGYVVPPHAHENDQTTWVFSGKWRFSLEGQTVDVGPGEMIFIRGNVVHTAEAVETLVGLRYLHTAAGGLAHGGIPT